MQLFIITLLCIIGTCLAVSPFNKQSARLVESSEDGKIDILHHEVLMELEAKLKVATTEEEKQQIQQRMDFFFGEVDKQSKEAAIAKWNSIKTNPDKFSRFRLVMRGFISTRAPGFWLDAHCGRGEHEYVGRVPRLADWNANQCFRTDSRHYSNDWDARARFNHKFDIGSGAVSVISPYSDRTVFYVCENPTILASFRKKCGDRDCVKTSDPSKCRNDLIVCYDGSTWKSCSGVSKPSIVYIRLSGVPTDPCTPPGTPAIDYNAKIYIMPYKGFIHIEGGFDDFPWMEVVALTDSQASGTNIVRMDPHGTLWSLMGGAGNKFSASRQL